MSVANGKATLFVGSLPPSTSPSELESLFSGFGMVKAKVIFDYGSMRSKQCALLFCPSVKVAKDIIDNTHMLDGRELRVDWADADKKGVKEVSHTLFVGNLLMNVQEADVQGYFNRFGTIIRIKLFRN